MPSTLDSHGFPINIFICLQECYDLRANTMAQYLKLILSPLPGGACTASAPALPISLAIEGSTAGPRMTYDSCTRQTGVALWQSC